MLNYQNRQGNQSGIETLKEVCAHAPEATAHLSGNARMPRIANPALKELPDDLVYIYRTADLYGGETAARNNTTFVLFSDRKFGTKEAAFEYLDRLGLVGLINELIGTILLVMPAVETGYTEEDLQNVYVLVNALFTQKAVVEIDGVKYCPAESEYCGGYGKTSFFGIGTGATFLNDFVAGSRVELIGRAASLFTYGGEMSETVTVTCPVPAFLVDPCGTALRKFREADATDTWSVKNGVESFRNSAFPLLEVRAAHDPDGDPGPWMVRACREMFLFLQRTNNLPTEHPEPKVTNPYQGYVPAPPVSRFSLSRRDPVIRGRTVIGDLEVTKVYDPDRFADLKLRLDQIDEKYRNFLACDNDYLDVWYEVLPQQVKDNTAPEHSVPLLLANHGGGDDPLMFLDETGLLLTAGEKQFAIVAGMHSGLTFVGADLVGEALSRLVRYMLDRYPALDPERVWVTGYSMGGAATYSCISQHPELYAAAVPMAMPLFGTPEGTAEKYRKYDMPVLLATSTYDFAAWDVEHNHINDGAQLMFRTFGALNGMAVPEQFDFVRYPFVGQPAASAEITTIGKQWRNFEWLIDSPKGYPLMGLNVTEYLRHSLWPGYGEIAWNFFRHYRRNAATGEIEYTE